MRERKFVCEKQDNERQNVFRECPDIVKVLH